MSDDVTRLVDKIRSEAMLHLDSYDDSDPRALDIVKLCDDYASLQQQLAQAQGELKRFREHWAIDSCEVDKALDVAGIDEWDKLPDGTDDEYGCRTHVQRVEMLAKERDDYKKRAEHAEARVKWLEKMPVIQDYEHGWQYDIAYTEWLAAEPTGREEEGR